MIPSNTGSPNLLKEWMRYYEATRKRAFYLPQPAPDSPLSGLDPDTVVEDDLPASSFSLVSYSSDGSNVFEEALTQEEFTVALMAVIRERARRK